MKKYSQSIIAFILFCIILLLISFSKEAKAGAIQGIELCEGIIIPSLLPVLIVSNSLIRLKSSPLSAILFGLISGYPAGAVLTCALYNDGVISSKEAERIMSFNFCGGCAFIISAVGSIIYKSATAGVILFASCVLSSIIIALFRFPLKSFKQKEKASNSVNLSNALCAATESAVKSIAVMSAYIILFSALLGIITIPKWATPLIEITNGICDSKTLIPLPFCAFFLSFGGLCIHFQLLPFLNKMKIKYYVFLFYRLLGASLSFFICKIIMLFFPNTELASASLAQTGPFEASKLGSGLSMIMIIGCAVVVFDLENRKQSLLHNA